MTAAPTVPDLLRTRRTAAPDQVPFLTPDGGELTFADWDDRSNALAHGLVAAGCRTGDRLVVLGAASRWLEYAVACLGVEKAGAVAVPMPADATPGQVERVVAHSGAGAVICPRDLAESGFSAPDWDPGELAAGRPTAPLPEPRCRPDDLAEVIYTSGSTGAFNGVACSHASLTFVPDGVPLPALDEPGSPYGERFLHFAPAGTNGAQGILHNALRSGHMTAVAMAAADVAATGAVVERFRIRALGLTPSLAAILLDIPEVWAHDLGSLRRVTVTGSAAPAALMVRLGDLLPGVELVNGYGLTEAGFASLRTVWDPARPTALGRGRPDVGARVTDEHRQPVGVGESGEIWLRPVGAPPRAYFHDAGLSARVFVDGWVRTSDLGYLDAGGFVHLIDRRKDVIISGGVNLSSLEVEDALAGHPAIREAAVVGVPHAVLGEFPAAVVAARAPVAVAELQAHVRLKLDDRRVPQMVLFVDALPRNAAGKVRKEDLRRRCAEAQGRRLPAPPGTATERSLVEIWSRLLDVPNVGVEDSFVELGGHSTLALQLLSRIREDLRVHIPLRAVFAAPTIRELARVVERAQARKTDGGWRRSGPPAPVRRPAPAGDHEEGES